MVTIREIMRHDVVTLPYGSSVVDAAKTMRERKIGSILIRLDKRIVGIVTEPDIVRDVVGADRAPESISVQGHHELSNYYD